MIKQLPDVWHEPWARKLRVLGRVCAEWGKLNSPGVQAAWAKLAGTNGQDVEQQWVIDWIAAAALLHDGFVDGEKEEGWVFDAVENRAAKRSPLILPWGELQSGQRLQLVFNYAQHDIENDIQKALAAAAAWARNRMGEQNQAAVISMLNRADKVAHNALLGVLSHSELCGDELANDPEILVESATMPDWHERFSGLGLLNTVLAITGVGVKVITEQEAAEAPTHGYEHTNIKLEVQTRDKLPHRPSQAVTDPVTGALRPVDEVIAERASRGIYPKKLPDQRPLHEQLNPGTVMQVLDQRPITELMAEETGQLPQAELDRMNAGVMANNDAVALGDLQMQIDHAAPNQLPGDAPVTDLHKWPTPQAEVNKVLDALNDARELAEPLSPGEQAASERLQAALALDHVVPFTPIGKPRTTAEAVSADAMRDVLAIEDAKVFTPPPQEKQP